MDMTAKKLPNCNYTKVGDQMVWPSLGQGDLEWQLRYGAPETVVQNRLVLASIVAAYQELIRAPQARRNAVCTALALAEKEAAATGPLDAPVALDTVSG